MKIEGVLESVVFFNEENGYSVLEIEVNGEPVTVTGNLPRLSEGTKISLEGEFVQHAKFGRQFAVKKFVGEISPKSASEITRYLASGLIKGVGPATAGLIVSHFGEKTLEILATRPDELKKIKGISTRKALEITNSYNEIKKMQEQIMYLQSLELTTNMSLKIYNVYRYRAKEMLDKNPYKLIDDIDGIGFLTADKIAAKMGISQDSIFRMRAGLVYTLKENGEKNGNTYLPLKVLLTKTTELLNCNYNELEENAPQILDNLTLEGLVKATEIEDEKCVALARYYHMEQSIAASLISRSNEHKKESENFDEDIAEFERINDIKFHKNQHAAVSEAANAGVAVITGGPGTGKTTILKCVLSIFKAQGKTVELVSPTGRAAKRLSEATGESAKTIHRLLGFDFDGEKMRFSYNETNQLDADIVIVDETSMLDTFILYSLLKALKKNTRILFVGDKDQLPSVGAGNILADIIDCGIFSVSFLTYIYRQGQDSLIISNAHRINEGKPPILDNKGAKDFFYSAKNDPAEILSAVLDFVVERLPTFTKTPPKDIQVLAPLKNGLAGVENLNISLQNAINPQSPNKPEVRDGLRLFRLGDKVMQTVNNYEIVWERFDKRGVQIEKGTGVFNGDIGFIKEINRATGETKIEWEDGRQSTYVLPDLKDLMLAYAVTIHKSQGSEFDVVVIPVSGGPYTILSRNLLYTAVTRAKKTVMLIGSKKNIEAMVRNNYTAQRFTLLKTFFQDEQKKYNNLFS